MNKRLTEKLALLDALLAKDKISHHEYEEQVQKLLEQSTTQNLGSWKLLQKIDEGLFEVRHRNRDMARMQGTRWLFVSKRPTREKSLQWAFFTHHSHPNLLRFDGYEIFGDFHLCSCSPFSTSPVIIPPQGLRMEVVQPWLQQLAEVFDFLREQDVPIGWLRLEDLTITHSGIIFITDLCRGREPSHLEQHLLDTGVKRELIVWVQIALSFLGSSNKKGQKEGEITDLEDMIAALTSGEGAGSITDFLDSCMSLLEGLQNSRKKEGISFDDPEGTVINIPIGKLHTISIPFVLVRPSQDEPFWISIHLITQELFEMVIGEHPCRNVGKRLPVDSVSRKQALEFCNQLSQTLGLDVLYVLRKSRNQRRTGLGISLPTVRQWRAVCFRGKSKVGWHADNSQRRSQTVDSSVANTLGVYDILGNLWEWLENGLESQDGMLAGGSWRSLEVDLEHNPIKKTSIRGTDDVGFRVVVTSS